MTDRNEYLNEARTRLAKPAARRRRPGSIAARVEVLKPEIQAARIAGKTWSEIAADIADDQALNADAVRVAFSRSPKGGTTKAKPRPIPGRASVVTEKSPRAPAGPTTDETRIQDMFEPMFDARDTRGRGRPTSANEGQAS